MPFPTTVSTDNAFPNSPGLSGPFVFGGSIYIFAVDVDISSTGTVVAYKSPDGIVWSAKDIANGPVTGGVALDTTFCTDGSKVYCISDESTATFLVVSVFDPSSDTWTSSTNSGIITSSPSVGVGDIFGACYRSSDGKLVIVFCPHSLVITSLAGHLVTRTAYILFDPVGLTFGSVVPCGKIGDVSDDTYYVPAFVAPGSSGLVHFFSIGTPVLGGENLSYQQALNGAALGTYVIVANPSAQACFTCQNFPVFSDGGTIVVAQWQDGTGGMIEILTGISADPISFLGKSVIVPSASIWDFRVFISSGKKYLFVSYNLATGSTIGYWVDSGSGFVGPTVLGNVAGLGYLAANTLPVPFSPNAPWGLLSRGTLVYWQNPVSSGGGGGVAPGNTIPTSGMNIVILPDPPSTHLCRWSGPVKCKCSGSGEQLFLNNKEMVEPNYAKYQSD